MKSKSLRVILSGMCLCSLWMLTISVNAAPVRFSQVAQVVNAKAGKANNGNFTQLRVIGGGSAVAGDDDDTKKTAAQQDTRVIVETRSDIVEDDSCDCVPLPPPTGGFPKYALLGLAAIPLIFIIRHHDDTPTPTPTSTLPPPPFTETPTPPPPMTPTPPDTPTPTPTTPEPVPEPVTILLFGTGLAGVGVAARKRLRRREDTTEN